MNTILNLKQFVILPLVAEHAESMSFIDYLLHSNVFNVLLALTFLYWVFKKFNVMGGLDVQQEKVSREIESVEARKAQALAQLEDIKKTTANLSKEVETILSNAKASADALSAQIIQSAEDEAAKIVEASKKRVALEQKSAAKALEARLLNDAIQDARDELARRLTSDEQKRSVEAFLAELPSLKQSR